MKKKKEIKKKIKKKRRIKIKVVLLFLVILYFIGLIIFTLINRPISSVYVSGNTYLSDWDVINSAKLSNYPSALITTNSSIKRKLEKNIYIKKAKVKRKSYTSIKIEIIENKPILYNSISNKTILADGTEVTNTSNVPILTNEVEKKYYNKFLTELDNVSLNILNKISEITYAPDSVDKKRFLLKMTDGNYVYLTLSKFNLINDYINIIKEFNNKKGILYLNSGGYFKIMKN
ncbi:MAG TPA: FtsQ-type POTRA domain-containing protein [Bacilli bacterium]|nr:FtsQ-type POTRA domain-containing protein [Bacilli bacterium]